MNAESSWERDGFQCPFVDEHGHRCSEKRYITLEHKQPFALGDPPTVHNLASLCKAHNAHRAREVFGEAHIAKKQAEDKTCSKVLSALTNLGFRSRQAKQAVGGIGLCEALGRVQRVSKDAKADPRREIPDALQPGLVLATSA